MTTTAESVRILARTPTQQNHAKLVRIRRQIDSWVRGPDAPCRLEDFEPMTPVLLALADDLAKFAPYSKPKPITGQVSLRDAFDRVNAAVGNILNPYSSFERDDADWPRIAKRLHAVYVELLRLI